MSFANRTLNKSQVKVAPYVTTRLVSVSSLSMPQGYSTVIGKFDTSSLNSISTASINFRTIGGLFYNQQAYSQSVVKPISHMTPAELVDYQQDSGSLDVRNYYYDAKESTSAQGTLDATYKRFSTGSNSEVVALSIPQIAFGENIKEGSFVVEASDKSYYIVDDTNGNLVDIVPYLDSVYGVGAYELDTYTGSVLSKTNLLYDVIRYSTSGSNTGSVGNIFYAQGIAVVVDAHYMSILPWS